jgi:DNA-directed RNA polymerase subunit RPC12/RpoP
MVEPGPNILHARCDACGHEIYLGYFTKGIEAGKTDPDKLFADEPNYAEQAKKAVLERVVIICGHCNAKIKVAKRFSGRKVRCSSCSQKILIPILHEEEQFDESLRMAGVKAIEAAAGRGARRKESARIRLARLRIRKKNLVAAGAIAAGIVLVGAIIYGFMSKKEFGNREIRIAIKTKTDGEKGLGKTVKPKVVVPKSSPASTATARLLRGSWSMFASGGHFPPRPGWMYFKAVVDLTAGSAPLKFPRTGKTVTLKLGDSEYHSLGSPVTGSMAPIRAQKTPIHIPPGKKRAVTFLFEIPVRDGAGSLVVQGLPPMPLRLTAPAVAVAPLAGEFEEKPPRNLHPLLRDPIMAAIQTASQRRMIVRRQADGFDVSIVGAGVTGRARPAGNGICLLNLRKGSHKLESKLYMMPDGQHVILHLSDEPMRQITYHRTSSHSAPPKRPQGSVRPIRLAPRPAGPTRRPVEKKPAAAKPDKGDKNPKEDDNEKPSFFGVPIY